MDEKKLLCITDGEVISLGELRDGVYSKRTMGDGFAVRCRPRLLKSLLHDSEKLSILAPTNGVLIKTENGGFNMRTGDGIEISVLLGKSVDADYLLDIGSKTPEGTPVCTVGRSEMENNGFGGSAMVLFTNVDKITELHVASGGHKAGDAAAFYKVRKI